MWSQWKITKHKRNQSSMYKTKQVELQELQMIKQWSESEPKKKKSKVIKGIKSNCQVAWARNKAL